MMTARDMVSRVTPPMKAPAPMSANAPGSTHTQGLGARYTPGGALHRQALSRRPPHSRRLDLAVPWCERQTSLACRCILKKGGTSYSHSFPNSFMQPQGLLPDSGWKQLQMGGASGRALC